MNKKTKVLAAIGISAAMLFTVVFAGTPANEGYEAFKDMLKQESLKHDLNENHEQGSMAFNIQVSENEQTKFQVSGQGQGNASQKEMSGILSITSPELVKELAIYGTEEGFVLHDIKEDAVYLGQKDDEENYRGKHGHRYDHDKDFNREWDDQSEAIFDYFMGDLAQGFEIISDTDGSQDILFSLESSEMPAIVNLIASAKGSRDFDRHEAYQDDALAGLPLFDALRNLENVVPELEEDVTVEAIRITFDRDLEGALQGVEFEVAVNGLDAQGEFHVLEINGDMYFDKNAAVMITPISIEGKTQYVLPKK